MRFFFRLWLPKILVLTIVCAAQMNSSGQSDTGRIAFIAYWALGDVYDFKVTKVRRQWTADVLTHDDTSQYVARFEVLDSTATSYRIRWNYKTHLLDNYEIPEELGANISELIVHDVIYTTTELGEFVGIENWKEISEMMIGLFTEMMEFLGTDLDEERKEQRKAVETLISIYSSKEGIELLVFKELYYFHFPFGLNLNVDAPTEYIEEIPNMIGGPPLQGNVRLHFENVDAGNAYCELVQEMVIDQKDAKRFLMDVFRKMKFDDREAKEALQRATYEIVDHNRYYYFYYPGIPVFIETKRESTIDITDAPVRRVDFVMIELIE